MSTISYRQQILNEAAEMERRAVKKANLKTAENMLKKGMSIDDISSCTSLSLLEIRKLAKQIMVKAC